MLYKLSPIQKHQEQIWPCHKNGQGQPRIIIWKYTAAGQGRQPQGQNFDVNRNLLSLWSFATSFKNISLKSDFIQFFSWFYTCIQPRSRLSLRSFVASSKKSLWSLILYNFFHDFIYVYSPGAGTDSPQGTKFSRQQKCIVTSFICCKFQKNAFEVWFYTFFFMI